MRLALLAATLAAGCNSILGIGDVKPGAGSADAPPGGVDAMVDAAPPSAVTGTSIWNYEDAPGVKVPVPEDLSLYTIAAYVPDGQGGYQIINGAGTKDGHFTIPQVPAGLYYLLFYPPNGSGYAFFETASHTLDMGMDTLGRTTGPQATMATNLTVQLTSMTPTIAGNSDQVEMVSFTDADTTYQYPPALPAGTTTLDISGDWSQMNVNYPAYAPLLQSGEDLWVLHYLRQGDNNFGLPETVAKIVDAYNTSNLTLVDGQSKTVTGAFAAVPQTKTLSVTLSESQFLQGLDVSPDQPVGFFIRRRVGVSNAAAQTLYGTLYVNQTYTRPTQFQSMNWTYGDPYPSTWPRFITDFFSLGWTYVTRGTNLPVIYTSSYTLERRDDASILNIAPFATAPHAIKVDNVVASTAVAIPYDGTHAVTVSWAPSVGVTHYVVTVQQIDAPGNQPTLTVIATFDTAESQVLMPANLFTNGASYMISVAADQHGNVDYAGGELRRIGFPRQLREGVTARLLFAASCGNGTVDAAYEECDSSGVNTAQCNADCTKSKCGDGVPNTAAGEQCDTGGESVICDADCTNVVCGDGHVNTLAGEQCDQGANNGVAGGCCTAQCLYAAGHTSCP
jgi:hypothetical protein